MKFAVLFAFLFAFVIRTAAATEPNAVFFQTDGISFSYTLPTGFCRVSAAEPGRDWLFTEMSKTAVVHVAFVRCDEVARGTAVSSFGYLSTPNTVKGETVPAGTLDFRTRYQAPGSSQPGGVVDVDAFNAAIQQASSGKPPEQFGPISLEEGLVSFGRINSISGQARMGIGVMAVIASRPFAQYLIAPLTTREDLERQNASSIDAVKSIRRTNP